MFFVRCSFLADHQFVSVSWPVPVTELCHSAPEDQMASILCKLCSLVQRLLLFTSAKKTVKQAEGKVSSESKAGQPQASLSSPCSLRGHTAHIMEV